jgi:hypothetical protein
MVKRLSMVTCVLRVLLKCLNEIKTEIGCHMLSSTITRKYYCLECAWGYDVVQEISNGLRSVAKLFSHDGYVR